jgi:uncharacterized Zn-binding protein involved in type VI secretion
MPGFMLHLGAQVQCTHLGQAQPTSVNPRVLVNGMPVVTLSSLYAVAGCTLPPPPAATGPCVTGQWLTGAVRVLVGGLPVLIFGGASTCVPTATPLIVLGSQTRVIAT